ncbi:sigma-70 family RNA polymerase sigma factor [Cytobacillus purgationiresistens]|uniref:RNA polymerase sigma-70 factor (ECF subfamily) n=1 Tax=Cytobacillus purgationiresistens TaxID=863449 RepID=A0ABU0AJP7_9BACI|nr:sigma-70 family RNA polymerase sigma factor [Cytobacillus purgationiresistens]MDQ0270633.1 RNA polymerase sigma-70 factor (ECF subfamily) [Cytobacillus purgationiresistens]
MEDRNRRLIKRAIKGDKKAFEQLLKKHYQQIYRTAFLYVQNQEDALDVVQEAAYQALISVHTIKSPEYFMTWLTKIVIRCSGQLLAKRKVIVPLTEEVLLSLKSSNGSINDDALLLMDALGSLKDSYRTALILFYYNDYSIKTISELMEIPEGTVKTYLSRGKEALKISLERGSLHG